MTRRTLLVLTAMVCLTVAVVAVACEQTPQAEGDSSALGFLQVGASYRAWSSEPEFYDFEVLEILNDKWILADMAHGGERWLNTDQFVVIVRF